MGAGGETGGAVGVAVSSLAVGGASEAVGAAMSFVVGGSSVLGAAERAGAAGVADAVSGPGLARACLPGRGGTAGAPLCASSGALAQTRTVAPSKRRLAIRIVNLFVDRKGDQLLAAKAAHAP
jgi:hypothetical protein